MYLSNPTSVWREVRSIPLPAYFVTLGVVLSGPLLLVNLVLEPSKPERPQPAPAGVSTGVAKPRTTIGSSIGSLQDAGRSAAVPRAVQVQHPLPATTGSALTQSAQEQPPNSGEAEPKPSTRAQKSTPQKRSVGHNSDGPRRNARNDAVRSSYAWGFSAAEGTLGPH